MLRTSLFCLLPLLASCIEQETVHYPVQQEHRIPQTRHGYQNPEPQVEVQRPYHRNSRHGYQSQSTPHAEVQRPPNNSSAQYGYKRKPSSPQAEVTNPGDDTRARNHGYQPRPSTPQVEVN